MSATTMPPPEVRTCENCWTDWPADQLHGKLALFCPRCRREEPPKPFGIDVRPEDIPAYMRKLATDIAVYHGRAVRITYWPDHHRYGWGYADAAIDTTFGGLIAALVYPLTQEPA